MSTPGPPGKSISERIHRMTRVDGNGCWLWTGSINRPTGYGVIGISGKTVFAHRASYMAFVGAIGEDREIDHLCRVRACVNPAHLEAVTHRENQRRGTSPPGVNSRKTHCLNGHEFSEENTYFTRVGSRGCKECRRQRAIAEYYRKSNPSRRYNTKRKQVSGDLTLVVTR